MSPDSQDPYSTERTRIEDTEGNVQGGAISLYQEIRMVDVSLREKAKGLRHRTKAADHYAYQAIVEVGKAEGDAMYLDLGCFCEGVLGRR
jgi:hypothetical protein